MESNKWKGWLIAINIILLLLNFFEYNDNHNELIYEYDICGVKGGDESTCKELLYSNGLEEGGEKCTLRKALLDYVNLHKRIMDPKETSVSKKYIVFDDEPEAGLGNRFQAMVAVFLYAIISKRALLIDWPEVKPFIHWNGEESVAMPHISELMDNPSFEWDYSLYKDKMEMFHCRNVTKYQNGDDRWYQCCNDIPHNSFEGDPSKLQMELGCVNITQYRGVEERFQCLNCEDDHSEEVIHFLTWDYFVPNLFLNPFHRSQLDERFPDGDIFTPLARFLLRPTQKIKEKIEEFKRLHFGKYTLGLQIRRVGINKLNEDQERVIWDCASESTYESFENVVKSKSNWWSRLMNADINKDVKWFLATDNLDTRTRAKKEFGEDKIIFYDAPITRNSSEGVMNGLIDMILMSECDDLIVSAASTYGKVAFGLRGNRNGGKPPKFVNHASKCVSRLDWQPCFFQFQKHWCMDKEIGGLDPSIILSSDEQIQIGDCRAS